MRNSEPSQFLFYPISEIFPMIRLLARLALLATGQDPIVVDYKITEKDVKGPFLKKLPAKMEDMKGLKSLDYTSPREAIAERFHMSEALLAALNPGKKFDEAGQTIAVMNV